MKQRTECTPSQYPHEWIRRGTGPERTTAGIRFWRLGHAFGARMHAGSVTPNFMGGLTVKTSMVRLFKGFSVPNALLPKPSSSEVRDPLTRSLFECLRVGSDPPEDNLSDTGWRAKLLRLHSGRCHPPLQRPVLSRAPPPPSTCPIRDGDPSYVGGGAATHSRTGAIRQCTCPEQESEHP